VDLLNPLDLSNQDSSSNDISQSLLNPSLAFMNPTALRPDAFSLNFADNPNDFLFV
jgi:hypothetical protein